jgi:hypothetical protein
MRASFIVFVLILLASVGCVAQDPITVVDFSWQREHRAAAKSGSEVLSPTRAVTNDNKYFQRKAREGQTNVTTDPNETTIDGRSAAIDKNIQEARSAKVDDLNGYTYRAKVRNSTSKTIKIIFWEYRFTEVANPQNVVRRQFICSVGIKPDDTKELAVFSTFGPSDVISTENLGKPGEKLFDEKVIVNRFEFSDGTLRQRGNWKYDDFQKSIERATSMPWGKEVCRDF